MNDEIIEERFDNKLIIIRKCLDNIIENMTNISLNFNITIPYLSITNLDYYLHNILDDKNDDTNLYSQIIKNFEFIIQKCLPLQLSMILKYYNIKTSSFNKEISLLDTIIKCVNIKENKLLDSNDTIESIVKINFTVYEIPIYTNIEHIDPKTFTIKIKNIDLINEINGLYINITTNKRFLSIYCYCIDDPLHIIKKDKLFIKLISKTTNYREKYNKLSNEKYFSNLQLRNILIDKLDNHDIHIAIKKRLDIIINCNSLCSSEFDKSNKKKCNDVNHFISKFASFSFDMKRLLIIYLSTFDVNSAIFLFEIIIKCNNIIAKQLLETLPILIKNIIISNNSKAVNTINVITNNINKDYLTLDEWYDNIKNKYPNDLFTIKIGEMIKLISNKNITDYDSKAHQWLETIRKVPFYEYHKLNIYHMYESFLAKINEQLTIEDKELIINDSQIWNYLNYNPLYKDEWFSILKERKEFMISAKKILDQSVFGQTIAKKTILNMLSRLCYVETTNICLGISGCPGIGKTTIIKDGLSKCLIDINNKSRPFITIPLGGATHASYLDGHGYTYQGSTIGRIINALTLTKVMNPIIYFDELDKVSSSPHGEEIINLLMNITDSNQNTEFFDKYCGFPLDISRCIFIFTYNDKNKIDKILLDRITHIELEPLAIHQKSYIFKHYALKKYSPNYGFLEDDITFTDDSIIEIIKNRTYEGGVRKLIEILNLILSKLKQKILYEFDYTYLNDKTLKNKKNKKYELINIDNLSYDQIISKYEIPNYLSSKIMIEYYLHIITNGKYKITITKDEIINFYLNDHPVYTNEETLCNSKAGIVYGLYSNNISQGGIIRIEIFNSKYQTKGTFCITGNVKDIMKESISVAYSVIINHYKIDFESGFHLNFPSIAVPKDGPSASSIIALGFYSLYYGKIISQHFSMTGELDMSGNMMKIGGLTAKINGGLISGKGIRNIVIPHDNYSELKNLIYLEDSIQLYPIKVIYFIYKEVSSKILIRIKNNIETNIYDSLEEINININSIPNYIKKNGNYNIINNKFINNNSGKNIFIFNIDNFDILDIDKYPSWLKINNNTLVIQAVNNINAAINIALSCPHDL